MRICSAPRQRPSAPKRDAAVEPLQQCRSLQQQRVTSRATRWRDRTFQLLLLLLLLRNHHHRLCYRHHHHSQQRQHKQASRSTLLGATTSRAHARFLLWRSHARRRRAPAPPSQSTRHLDRCPSCLSPSLSPSPRNMQSPRSDFKAPLPSISSTSAATRPFSTRTHSYPAHPQPPPLPLKHQHQHARYLPTTSST